MTTMLSYVWTRNYDTKQLRFHFIYIVIINHSKFHISSLMIWLYYTYTYLVSSSNTHNILHHTTVHYFIKVTG